MVTSISKIDKLWFSFLSYRFIDGVRDCCSEADNASSEQVSCKISDMRVIPIENWDTQYNNNSN